MEELLQKWDVFANDFVKYIEPSTKISLYSLLHALEIEKGNAILELACGGGGGTLLAHPLLSKDARLVVSDFSPNMLQIASDRLSKLENPKPELHKVNVQDIPFDKDSFDRIYANYVLHLVPDPDKAIQEIYRVLQPGGRAGFTVWGRPENSPKFTIDYESKIESGITTQFPQGFSLHDKEALKERFLKAGFSKVFAWYSVEPTQIFSPKEYETVFITGTPANRKLFSTLPPETVQKYKEKVAEKVEAVLKSGTPITTEVLFVVAFK